MKKNYHLIVDVGNSTTVFGVFEGENYIDQVLFGTFEYSKNTVKTGMENLISRLSKNEFEIKEAMIFSVVPGAINKVSKIIRKYFKIKSLVFDWEKYDFKQKDPRITDKIGADLVADIVGAKKLYGQPAMVCDLGTVNKILVLDGSGIFVGASFTPGMQSQLGRFSRDTALLPSASGMDKMDEKTGLNTLESMKHGVYWSTVGYIEHEHEAQKALLKSPVKLILTGGNSYLIKDNIKDKIHDPLLTLKGMNILFMEETK